MLAIKVKNLVKQYKTGLKALNNLNLEVKKGEIFSLLGQNGAGKSSLINILTTYIPKTSGEVTILGKDIEKEPASIRKEIACVFQHTSIDNHLSMKENMLFQARLYKVNSQTSQKRMKHLIKIFKLEDYLKYPVSSYSGGIKRRLDIAMNMMSEPKILFLDEPTVGMDIQSRMAMWNMMKKIRDDFKTTIFLTTHYLEEADKLSDTICIMKNGQEIIQASPSDLRKYTQKDVLRISFDKNEEAKSCRSNLSESVVLKDSYIILGTKNSKKDLVSINKWLLEHYIPFTGIEILKPSLDDIFLNLTEGKEVVS